MEYEGRVLAALGCGGVRVAELRRPGEVEQVVVEVLCGRGLDGKRCRMRTRDRFGYGLGLWVTRRQGEKVEEEDDESLLHGEEQLIRIRSKAEYRVVGQFDVND